MKTYDDLEKKDKHKLDSIIDSLEDSKKYTMYGTHSSIHYGLCSSCEWFITVESEYKVLLAKCDELDIKLSTIHPVETCSKYKKRGSLSLWDMKSMAIIIDIPQNKIGFEGV